MAIQYTDKVLKNFTNPQNIGEILNPDGNSTQGSPACGDMVNITLKVNKETQTIEDIKFKSYGCASNIATASMLTQLVKGKTIQQAKELKHKDVTEELGGLPTVKIHCSVLATDTLKGAIMDYEKKNGLLKEDLDILNLPNIKLRLQSVINPKTGADIIASNLVKSYTIIEEGVINVSLKVCQNFEYSQNIKEEIEEHVSTLKGYKKLNVLYGCG